MIHAPDQAGPHRSNHEDDTSLLRWRRWKLLRGRTLRRLRDGELADALRQELMVLAPAVGMAAGATSTPMRLVARAIYGSATDDAERLRQLRLAKHALDQLSTDQRDRVRHIAAQINAGCWRTTDTLRQTSSGSQPCVAVVVDNPALHRAAKEALQPFGFQVHSADHAELIPAAMQLDAPSLVILDILSASGDSIGLTRHLVHHQVPVIVICTLPVETTTPAIVFLRRTFDRDTLLAAVFRVMGLTG